MNWAEIKTEIDAMSAAVQNFIVLSFQFEQWALIEREWKKKYEINIEKNGTEREYHLEKVSAL